MQTNSVPFNFYDHVACMFPCAILFSYILFIMNKFFYPEIGDYLIRLNSFSSVIFIFVLLIGSFTCGHIAYSISKWSFGLKILNHSDKPIDKFLDYPEQKQLEIINEIGYIYGSDIGKEVKQLYVKYKKGQISGSQFGIKNYCYALVERKEAKHDMFVALADFLRSTAFLIFMAFFYLVCEILFDIFKSCNFELIDLFNLLAIFIFMGIPGMTLFRRSIRMRKAADSLIYSQFLFDAKN